MIKNVFVENNFIKEKKEFLEKNIITPLKISNRIFTSLKGISDLAL